MDLITGSYYDKDVFMGICVMCYVVWLYLVGVCISCCSWLRLILGVDVGIRSFRDDLMVRILVLRLIGIGGRDIFQLRWCHRAYVDLSDVGYPAGICRMNTFGDLMTSRRFLAHSRMNVRLRGGEGNDPIDHLDN